MKIRTRQKASKNLSTKVAVLNQASQKRRVRLLSTSPIISYDMAFRRVDVPTTVSISFINGYKKAEV